jgi:hypothetical protein
MAIAVDKSQREKAKKEGLYLVQISVDGKYVKEGGWAITGAFTKDMADELRELYMKWAKAGKL